jgi:hypothetical protein
MACAVRDAHRISEQEQQAVRLQRRWRWDLLPRHRGSRTEQPRLRTVATAGAAVTPPAPVTPAHTPVRDTRGWSTSVAAQTTSRVGPRVGLVAPLTQCVARPRARARACTAPRAGLSGPPPGTRTMRGSPTTPPRSRRPPPPTGAGRRWRWRRWGSWRRRTTRRSRASRRRS